MNCICGAKVADDLSFCPECGRQCRCLSCKKELAPGMKFCGHCGAPVLPRAEDYDGQQPENGNQVKMPPIPVPLQETDQKSPKKRKTKYGIIAGAGAAALAVIVLVVLLLTGVFGPVFPDQTKDAQKEPGETVSALPEEEPGQDIMPEAELAEPVPTLQAEETVQDAIAEIVPEESAPVPQDEGTGQNSMPKLEINEKVGISMPTDMLERWRRDGENMKAGLEAFGYRVDLRYADNDIQRQVDQVTDMIESGCSVVVIAAVEGDSMGSALDRAGEKDVKVVAYDRLLFDNWNVDYYATFDNYLVGTVQGEYVVYAMDLRNAAGPFNVEFTAGDPGDSYAWLFYQGAMDVLRPYIDSGKLIVKSGQIEFDQVATPNWRTEVAQTRAADILASAYSDGSQIDAWVCSNDSTALGVINALSSGYSGGWPVITGQDCDRTNMKMIIEGRQSMSVFRDTRTLCGQVVRMVDQILKGEEVDVNDTATYHNNKKIVPAFLCWPVYADANNYRELLIESGYYTEDDLR